MPKSSVSGVEKVDSSVAIMMCERSQVLYRERIIEKKGGEGERGTEDETKRYYYN